MKSMIIKLLFSLFFVFIIILLVYYFYPRKVDIYSEDKIILSKDSIDIFPWTSIYEQSGKSLWEEKLGCKLPDVNLRKQYLYLSKGRRISSISYKWISKYLWDYEETYLGDVEFIGNYEKNVIFVYKTDTILCLPKQD